MNSKKLFTLIFAFLPFILSAQIYVNQQATGANSGASWADAYTDLQDAIQDAGLGEEIWVAAGTYLPSTNGDVDASFTVTHGISLYGGFAGDESAVSDRDIDNNPTVLSGDYNGDDIISVTTDPLNVTFANNGENAKKVFNAANFVGSLVLDGFTVSGGNSTSTGPGAYFSPNGTSSALVANCYFRDNYTTFGGAGIFLSSGDLGELLNFRMRNTTASHNKCFGGGSKGGALWATGNGWILADYINCLFHQNQTNSRAGAIEHDLNVEAAYSNCIFSENYASSGGATFENGSGPVTYSNCTFYKNDSFNPGGEGSAIYNFSDFGSTDVELNNCIFFENGMRPLLGNGPSDYIVSNCILEYANFNGLNNDASGSTDLGGNQYLVDPQFIDAAGVDFSLSAGSPAVNAGDNSLVVGLLDYTDMIARIVDGTVDLGALEYHLPLNAEAGFPIPCFGEPFISVAIVPDNYPPFSYEWSDPNVSGPNPDNLTVGNYQVTITNFIGDQIILEFNITENPEITADFIVVDPTGSNADGSATVDASGGTAPFTFEWDTSPVQTGATASDLVTGTYTVTVTDANGCELVASVDVGPVAVISIDETAEIQVGPNPFTDQVQITLSGSLLQSNDLTKLVIYNTAGQLIFQKSISQEQVINLNLSHLPAGLYILELDSEDTRYQKRLVKF